MSSQPTDLPPFRAAYEDGRLADHAWCSALAAHRDSNDPVTLPDRLQLTSAAASQLSRALARADALGLQWNPFPRPASRYGLPGELSTTERPLAPDGWIALANAERRLAEASCEPHINALAQALALFSETCAYLRGQITAAGATR